MLSKINQTLSSFETIFWDFDGTIKDTNIIKADVFEELFCNYGAEFSQRVRDHHIENCGISRYEKISLYLGWLGIDNKKIAEGYVNNFSEKVIDRVIQSKWIEEVRLYIFKNYKKQKFIIVTATPQKEIEYILKQIGIYNMFDSVFGYPTKKPIKSYIKKNNLENNSCIMVGDSKQDEIAAESSGILFCHSSDFYSTNKYIGTV